MKKLKIPIAFLLILINILFIFLIKNVDVAAIGPEGSYVGFSSINGLVHNFFGISMTWYKITQMLGYLSLLVAVAMAIVGIVEWIRRRKLSKVDHEIISLGILFVVVIMIYVFFEIFVVSYRPIIMPDEYELEASYPSSHTMLALTIFGGASICMRTIINNRPINTIIRSILNALAAITIIGRLLSGVHWFTDILGGALISTMLLLFYSGLNDKLRRRKR